MYANVWVSFEKELRKIVIYDKSMEKNVPSVFSLNRLEMAISRGSRRG
jgi:hypothetical protein